MVRPGAEDVLAGRGVLAAGEVAVVIVAGGQGTRLGFDGPKGCYPIGPVSDRSLFQIHAEKVVALGRRHGAPVPLYVMTSPQNHAETAAFFERHDSFGVERLRLFVQGEMPAVDRLSGRILLAERGRVALSPDGHGGTSSVRSSEAARSPRWPSAASARSSTSRSTTRWSRSATPGSSACTAGRAPRCRRRSSGRPIPPRRSGLVVVRDGRQEMIEYSDLPDDLAERRAADGGLELWAGSIALHLIDVAFAARLAGGGGRLPFHRALQAGAVRGRARAAASSPTSRTPSSSSSSSSTRSRWPSARSSSRPTARRSSSRSRTPPARPRPRRCGPG